jgi:hypothetical protein
MTSTTERGTLGAASDSDRAGTDAITCKYSWRVPDLWTGSLVRSVKAVAPTDHRSERGSTAPLLPLACSGDMKSGVPRISPARVDMREPMASLMRARPKSSTFSPPSLVRKTLSGFTSR